MDEEEQAKPLTPTASGHQTVKIAEEIPDTIKRPSTYGPIEPDSRGWRCIVSCCGSCSAAVAVLGLLTLVLTFTVFRVKDPVLTLNTIYVNNFSIILATPSRPMSVNATLIADISIKNPNAASLQFDSSTTEFYYMGQTVGVGYSPWTKVSAEGAVRMNLTVDVLADQVAVVTNATGSVVMHGYVNLTSYTDVRGRVNMMGIFNHEIEVAMNCSMSVDVPLSSEQVKDKVCQAYVQ